MQLNSKVCVITGAARYLRQFADPSGIGLESALLFVQEGAYVVMADVNQQAGEQALQKVLSVAAKYPSPSTTRGVRAIFVKTDVSKEAEVKHLIETAENTYGAVHVVFNNAGIMDSADDNAETTPEQVWDKTMNINVKGVWYGCKYAIPAMRRAGGGSIINTASFVAIMGAATPQLAYTASKGAVLAMTRELAIVHARENIRLNSLCPGPLKTPLLMNFLNTEEKKERRMVHLPMGRFGEAIEQAKAALFLASDQSSYVTGTDFLVDGGLSNAYVTPLGETKSKCPWESLIQ